jgi:hypothetical protein
MSSQTKDNLGNAKPDCVLCHGTGKVILKLVCFGPNPHREERVCSCVFLNSIKTKQKEGKA